MKLKLKCLLCAAVVSALTLPALALAQDTSNLGTNGPDDAPAPISHSQPLIQHRDTAKASDILGMAVKNYQDEKLGSVSDLAVDMVSGQVVEVILMRRGYLGLNNSYRAVPPELLHQSAGRKLLQMDASVASIDAAPNFDPTKWNLCTRSNWVTAVYGYFGLRAYFVPEHGEYRTTSVDGKFASSLPRNMDGTINTTGSGSVDATHNQEVAGDLAETHNPIIIQFPDGTWITNRLVHADTAITTWSSMVYLQQASKLMGKPVFNLQNEKLGKVKNFALDLPAGRIVAVIISSGGFIGVADTLSAISPKILRYDAQQRTLLLDCTPEKLAGLPHFKGNEWPDIIPSVLASGLN
jgi:sporulation protein YlmC with PRC-barrel domain